MTSDEQLLVYIRNQLGSGQSPENIKQALIQKGWRLDVVNQAMNDVGEVDPVKKAVDVKETNEKSQEKKPSRMKFLLILVVAVVIVLVVFMFIPGVGLFSLGVFNPDTFPHNTATGFSNIGLPEHWEHSGSSLTMVFMNSAPYSMTITKVTATNCNTLYPDREFNTDDTLELRFTGCEYVPSGSSYFVKIDISYIDDMGFDVQEIGMITGIAS